MGEDDEDDDLSAQSLTMLDQWEIEKRKEREKGREASMEEGILCMYVNCNECVRKHLEVGSSFFFINTKEMKREYTLLSKGNMYAYVLFQ